MSFDSTDIVLSFVKIAIVLGALLNVTPIMAWVERRGSALIQDRLGPNRVGPFGLIQSFADALKFILKEDLVPAQAHRVLYTLAPMFGLIPALTTIAVVPWGRAFTIPERITFTPLAGLGAMIAIAALIALAAVVVLATSRLQKKGGGRISLNVAVGWLVAAALSLVALLIAAAMLWLRSAGSIRVPAGGRLFEPIVADVNIGILLIFALASMSVYGLATAGWSSNNKFSLFGGLRASAQMISYELSLTLAAVGTLMAAGSLRLVDVVERQAGHFVLVDFLVLPAWNIFPMFLGFIVFFVSSFAETNRLPFDFPEADSELVAGYHTEYSSMKFAMFFMAEYMAMTTISALVVTLFLGGWDIPWYDEPATFGGFLLSALSFTTKVAIILFIFVWVRWTIPRLKYNMLMSLGWKFFLPLAFVNIIVVALLITMGWI